MTPPSMQEGFRQAVQLCVRIFYGVAGFIWLLAVALAAYRLYQMRTLTVIDAEVLKAEMESYSETSRDTDAQTGFTSETSAPMYQPVVLVRYAFQGKTYTAEARHSTASSFRSLESFVTRKWKPGARLRVHIDPNKPDRPVPDLGINLPTFQASITLLTAGAVFALFAYGFGRFGQFGFRLMEQLKNSHAR